MATVEQIYGKAAAMRMRTEKAVLEQYSVCTSLVVVFFFFLLWYLYLLTDVLIPVIASSWFTKLSCWIGDYYGNR
jgi:hypothetical protein